jgi:hypothetical protein
MRDLCRQFVGIEQSDRFAKPAMMRLGNATPFLV